ncbi:MAG TPA: hypothetical protein VGN27_11220 [Gaiellaceae bacterium]|nr:hypothetical protein [Gaiellaceae bacterium]
MSEALGSEPQGPARDERLAQNEVIFRTVNESIEQQALEFGGLDAYEFICECSSSACFERISLTLAQYEGIRREGTTFVVRTGHEYDEIELVVEKQATYSVVRKDGAAGIIAEFADPRDAE